MNKKILTSFAFAVLLLGLFNVSAYAEQNTPAEGDKQVQLTENQKAELADIYRDLFEEKKELIQKYVEFGVIPKEKGDQMIQKFDERFKMMEQNGFMLPRNIFSLLCIEGIRHGRTADIQIEQQIRNKERTEADQIPSNCLDP